MMRRTNIFAGNFAVWFQPDEKAGSLDSATSALVHCKVNPAVLPPPLRVSTKPGASCGIFMSKLPTFMDIVALVPHSQHVKVAIVKPNQARPLRRRESTNWYGGTFGSTAANRGS
eukprot:4616665-Pleurochrysis_carterae.AAC.1